MVGWLEIISSSAFFKMTMSGMSPSDPYSHQCRSGETSCPYFLKNVSETFRFELLLKWWTWHAGPLVLKAGKWITFIDSEWGLTNPVCEAWSCFPLWQRDYHEQGHLAIDG